MSARPSRLPSPLPPPLPPGIAPGRDPVGAVRGLIISIDSTPARLEGMEVAEQLALLRAHRLAFLRLLAQVRDTWVLRIIDTLDAAERDQMRAWVVRIEMARQDQNLCDLDAVRLTGARKRAHMVWGLYDLAFKLGALLAVIEGRAPDPARQAAARAARDRIGEA